MKESWRSNFTALQQRLVLTREEMRVIVFIVIALTLGLMAGHYRDANSSAPAKQLSEIRVPHASRATATSAKRALQQTRRKKLDAKQSSEVRDAPE